jgi:hypothetical protein
MSLHTWPREYLLRSLPPTIITATSGCTGCCTRDPSQRTRDGYDRYVFVPSFNRTFPRLVIL